MSFNCTFNQRRNLTKIVVAFAIVYITGCFTTSYDVTTDKQNIFFYSTEKEIEIGRSVSKQIAKQLEFSNNPKDLKRVRNIGEKIASVCDRQELEYYFYVIDEDVKNAFSIPGGYVYIYKGLMDILNDDELAFVIAHEIGHIVSRHSIKRMQAQMGMNLLLLASTQVKSDSDFDAGVYLALGQITAAYSREDEFTADGLAGKYLGFTEYNPASGIEVFEKLYQEGKKEPLRPIAYFRTHPFADQRIRKIKESLGIPLDVKDYIN